MRLLLLGATGEMGGRAAAELLRHREVEQLTLAGRNADRLVQLSDRLRGHPQLHTACFDIHSAGELRSQMARHDVVASCAGPGYELEVPCVEAALEVRRHYVSLNDDAEAAATARSLSAGAEDDLRIISGCGASPGLSNLLVALASLELDRVEEVLVAVGASTRDAGGPAADLHFVTMLTNGTPQRGPGSRAPHPVYFPEPVGWMETFACSHPEELAFGAATAGGAVVEFRIGLAEKAVMDAVRATVATRLTANEAAKRAWLKLARPVRPLLEQLSPGQGGWTAIRVDVHGRTGGRSRTLSYGVVDRLGNLVSIALAEAAVRLAHADGPGQTPEEAFDPRSFLSAVADRGVRFGRLEPHHL